MIHNGFLAFQSCFGLNFDSITHVMFPFIAKQRVTMNQGKLVFPQRISFLPLSILHRCVATHRGDRKVQDFTCICQFLTMAFAELTYRESLRDIEVDLRDQAKRLCDMGTHCQTVSRNALSNANAARPWQIYAEFAQHFFEWVPRPLEKRNFFSPR